MQTGAAAVGVMENPQNASGFHSKQALQLENNHRTANARQECTLT